MITFRRMVVEDLVKVVELEKRIFKDYWSLANFKNEINNRDISYPFLMLIDTAFVGYGVVLNLIDEIHINNVAVAPEFRGQGLGNKLMEHILAVFPDHSEAWLEVRQSNSVAIKLYQKFNFEQIYLRQNYYSDGENAVIMCRISAKIT